MYVRYLWQPPKDQVGAEADVECHLCQFGQIKRKCYPLSLQRRLSLTGTKHRGDRVEGRHCWVAEACLICLSLFIVEDFAFFKIIAVFNDPVRITWDACERRGLS